MVPTSDSDWLNLLSAIYVVYSLLERLMESFFFLEKNILVTSKLLKSLQQEENERTHVRTSYNKFELINFLNIKNALQIVRLASTIDLDCSIQFESVTRR